METKLKLPHVIAILGVSNEGKSLAIQKLTAWCEKQKIPLEYVCIETPEELEALHLRIRKDTFYLIDGSPETREESEHLMAWVKDSSIDSLLGLEVLPFWPPATASAVSAKSPEANERDAKWLSERDSVRRHLVLHTAYANVMYDEQDDTMLTNHLALLFSPTTKEPVP